MIFINWIKQILLNDAATAEPAGINLRITEDGNYRVLEDGITLRALQ